MKHYRSHSPIKSKFGCVIFDARELQGWQTTGSTASVSLTRSEINIYEQFHETFTLIYGIHTRIMLTAHKIVCESLFTYLYECLCANFISYPHALFIYA